MHCSKLGCGVFSDESLCLSCTRHYWSTWQNLNSIAPLPSLFWIEHSRAKKKRKQVLRTWAINAFFLSFSLLHHSNEYNCTIDWYNPHVTANTLELCSLLWVVDKTTTNGSCEIDNENHHKCGILNRLSSQNISPCYTFFNLLYFKLPCLIKN
jgi:hypothetical protein